MVDIVVSLYMKSQVKNSPNISRNVAIKKMLNSLVLIIKLQCKLPFDPCLARLSLVRITSLSKYHRKILILRGEF
jgi:hypothetical protein